MDCKHLLSDKPLKDTIYHKKALQVSFLYRTITN